MPRFIPRTRHAIIDTALSLALLSALIGCGSGGSGSANTASTNVPNSDSTSNPSSPSSPNNSTPSGANSGTTPEVRWTITNLSPLLGPNTAPASLNNAGAILANVNEHPPSSVGQMGGQNHQHPVIYQNGQLTSLGHLRGSMTLGNQINNHGQVAGTDFDESDQQIRGFIYSNGQMQDIATLGGGIFAPVSINDQGHIAGTANTTDDTGHLRTIAVTLIDGQRQALPLATGDFQSQAMKINAKDEVLMIGTDGTGPHSLLFSAGAVHDFNNLSGCDSPYIVALNDNSQMAGTCGGSQAVFAGTATKAFILKAGVLSYLPPTFGVDIIPRAMNNKGQVIGLIHVAVDTGKSDTPSHAHAFLFDGAKLVDLDQLSEVTSVGWMLTDAMLINDAGQILAYGYLNGAPGIVLLTPPRGL